MEKLLILNRKTKALEEEKIYGRIFLQALYGKGFFSSMLSKTILPVISKVPFFSNFYGFLQKSRLSRWKVKSFIKVFNIDISEFEENVEDFSCFNDFFIRKLKPSARPLVSQENRLALPADGRYLVFDNLQETSSFYVKGKKFCLSSLLQDPELEKKYREGSLVIARLCPTDYHRFHFPCDGIPGEPHAIPGHLYSVNPLALRKNIDILCENKRMLTEFKTEKFGTILYIEVGATYVGTIVQTFTPFKPCLKGEEKGYFSFGGSCLLLLFEKDRVIFDEDLLKASSKHIETKALLGESLGIATQTNNNKAIK